MSKPLNYNKALFADEKTKFMLRGKKMRFRAREINRSIKKTAGYHADKLILDTFI
jgi:hypothetical protein